MKLLITGLFLSFALVGSWAQADVRYVGNAGTGVMIDDVAYLLDLYEVDNVNPVIDESIEPKSAYVSALSDLDILTPQEIKLLAIKLTEIRQFAPSYADSLVVATNQYVWRLVSTPLTLLPDSSPVDVKNKLVQLANRYGPYVRISQMYWDKLPSSNRVALILHEIISATLPLTKVAGQPHLFIQDIAAVRNRVAYIFLPQFKARGVQAFLNLTGIEWGLSTLLDKHTYSVVNTIVSWKFNKDEILNMYPQIVSRNGLDQGFCKWMDIKLANDASPISISFYYSAATVSQKFINYDSSFGTQSALQETAPAFRDIQIRKIQFTRDNIHNCMDVVEQITLTVFNIFDMQEVTRIEQFPSRSRVSNDKLN